MSNNLYIFPDLSLRTLHSELMDQPTITDADLLSALAGLNTLRSLSFTVEQIWKQIYDWTKKTKLKKIRVLDIASGGGDVLIGLAELAKRNDILLEGIGVDMNQRSCKRANDLSSAKNLSVKFKVQEIFIEETFKDFDIAICTLFLHHLDLSQIDNLFTLINESEVKLFIANDLKRSTLGYLLAFLATRIFTRSAIVHQDALLSIKAAFTTKEIHSHLSDAGMGNAKILSAWPERFMIIWNKSQ